MINPRRKQNFVSIDDPAIVLENLLANIPGHIYWKNQDGVYLGCNRRQAESLGFWHCNQVIGKTDFELPWDKESAKRFWDNDRYVLKTGNSKTIEEPATIHGRKATMLSLKAPFKNRNGEIQGILGISIDITKQKQTEAKLIQAKEAVEAANQAKIEFLENMRHDIRTPLVGIVGCAKIIRENIENQNQMATLAEYADNVVTSSETLANLLNEVLEAINIQHRETFLKTQKFSLKEKLIAVVNLNLARAKEKQLELTLEYDRRLPQYLLGDGDKIQRIILELVTNALNFTEVGHVKVIAQQAKQLDKMVIVKLSVADSGIGIEAGKQKDVFASFKRLTPAYKGLYPGVGLGLSLINELIKDFGGEIYLESRPQIGSTFTCVIPLEETLLDELDTNLHQQNQLTNTQSDVLPLTKIKSKGEVHVLLVEDEHITAKVTTSLLTGLNCHIDHAQDGKMALCYFEKHYYDLIFLDIGLPDISGFEVARRIRACEASQNKQAIPIIALTAHLDHKNNTDFLEAGIQTVVSKPLTKVIALNILKKFVFGL